MFAIKKNGKYVKDFSDGEELTTVFNQIELYRTKASAVNAAREYGSKYGKGYTVVKMY